MVRYAPARGRVSVNYNQAVDYISGRLQFGIKLGNERFTALMERLGNPQRAYPIAHVAGTKGKGSTTAMIASILGEHGFKVGGYYSPYVYDLCERIQVDGVNIPPEDFARQVTEIAPHVEALKTAGLEDTTEFELKTAVGFRYFAQSAVDFAAVEVGLGGRLDATNIVDPSATVITNIGLDHTHILGDTHSKIAFEKAGIVKEGIPLITATDDPDALAVIRQVANERSAHLSYVSEAPPGVGGDSSHIRYYAQGGSLTVSTAIRLYPDLHLGMVGHHQFANAACAIGAVETLGERCGFNVNADKVSMGLAKARLPGRFEIRRHNPTFVLDGAHNAISALAVSEEIARMKWDRLFLVIGMTIGHPPEEFLRPFIPSANRLFATLPTRYKALPAEDIADAAAKLGMESEIIRDPREAARRALAEAGSDDLVLITGSFYIVGDIPPGSV